jgi:quinate dehydrogenase
MIASFQEVDVFTGRADLGWKCGAGEEIGDAGAGCGVADLTPTEEGKVIERDVVNCFLGREQKGLVLEMCYHPKLRTTFFDAAEKARWKVLPGTESMIHQAVAQQVLWTELPLETFKLDEIKRAVSE